MRASSASAFARLKPAFRGYQNVRSLVGWYSGTDSRPRLRRMTCSKRLCMVYPISDANLGRLCPIWENSRNCRQDGLAHMGYEAIRVDWRSLVHSVNSSE
jgi:hypothetical protein